MKKALFIHYIIIIIYSYIIIYYIHYIIIHFLASTIMRTDMLLNAIVVKLDQGKNGMDLVLKEVGIMTQGEWEMAVEEVA